MSSIELEPGNTISHFRLEKVLGEGGMGAVYLAEDLTLSRRVAVKFMKRALLAQNVAEAARKGIEQRFIREAKTAAAINHPNLAQIYEANFDSDNWFIAMEFIDGTSLQENLERGRVFKPGEIISITHQVVSGLKHAWDDYQIIHRDIKTANIMLTRGDIVKIVDLGLAKPMSEQDEDMPDLTGAGVPIGTPQYMAPEQATGQTDLDFRVDIFALGATIYELCTGKKAFSGKTAPMIYMAQMAKKYEPLTNTRDDLPSAFVKLLDQMLEPKVKDRIGTYDEILAVLDSLRSGGSPLATGPNQTQTRLSTVFGATAVQNEFYPNDFLIADRYRVLRPIGKSRAGFVYRCMDKELGVECAVKSLFPGREFPAADMPRIKKNLQRLLQLTHPNLVQIRDIREDESTGELFVVMELLNGRNLREYTHKQTTEHGTLSVALIAPVLQKIAAAVDSINQTVGFAHQDLKPESIYLVENDTQIKLLDYGMVELADNDAVDNDSVAAATEPEKFTVPLACPDYMAPEIWRRKSAEIQADEYSLGVIVYEMLSHKLPFWLHDQAADSPPDTGDGTSLNTQKAMYRRMRLRVLEEPPPPLPNVGRGAARAINRALAKQPAMRYPDCQTFIRDLTSRSQIVPILGVIAGLAIIGAVLLIFQPKEEAQSGNQESSSTSPPPLSAAPGTRIEQVTVPKPPLPSVPPKPKPPPIKTPDKTPGSSTVVTTPQKTPPLPAPKTPKTASARIEVDAAAQARLAMQAQLRDKKLSAEAQRLQETLQNLQNTLTQNPRAAEFMPQLNKLTKVAEGTLKKKDYPASLKAFREAIRFARDLEDQVKELMREEAQELQKQTTLVTKELAPYKGASPDISERMVKCDVTLALARNKFEQEDFSESIRHYQTGLKESRALLTLVKNRYTPKIGKNFTLLKTGMDLVWVKAFQGWCTKYEITNGQYRCFKPDHDSKRQEGFSLNGNQQPAVELSYYDAVAFAEWLSVTAAANGNLPEGYEFRLPSRTEWLTLARCGTERLFPWGNKWPPKYGNFGNQEVFPQQWKLDGYTDEFPVTCDVRKSGANEWGIYGIAGNVWEWTSEMKGNKRAVLGGAWTSCSRTEITCPPKGNFYAAADTPYDNIGFRLLLMKSKKTSAP